MRTLTERGIPTFSMSGAPDVDNGAFATLLPDLTEPVVRRVALNLSRLIRGESTSDLPVILTVDTRLFINGRTAAAVGWIPTWETRIFASFRYEDELDEQGAGALTLSEALSQASSNNTFLSIQDEVVESVRQDRARSRSALLPQAGVDLRYRNSNVSEAFKAIFPTNSTFLGLSIRQMIYDDQAVTNYRSSLKVLEGTELERDAERNRVLGDAGISFLGLGLTQALYRVSIDNLRLSESFLQLARLRREVGYSGADEILRWEAAVAVSRADLFDAAENVEAARITLNRILGTDQDRRWLPQSIDVDPDVFPFLDGRLDAVFDSPESLDALRRALAALAIRNAPEIMAINKDIEALDLQLGNLKRRFYVPRTFLSYSLSHQLSGDTDNRPSDSASTSFLTVSAEYPLFAGGQRIADLRKAEADRRVLERQRAFTEELIEQESRTALRRAESSFPRVRFARQAVDAARQNLAIVQDKYSEGIVDVTALISAQNEKLTAEQLAAAAVFDFLIDLVELQRALSWFEDEKSGAERDALYREITAAIEGSQP